MSERLNDTKAIVDMGKRSNDRDSFNMHVRSINNGYITSESGYDNKGNYYCREVYTQEKPVKDNVLSESTHPMKTAVQYLKK